MKTKLFISVAFAVASLVFSGCGNSEEHDSMHLDESKEKVDSHTMRDYNVDVVTLDENKDGNVFQCPMDWNVISDKPGKCPLCKMTLKEVTLEEAKKNLKENDFNVTEK